MPDAYFPHRPYAEQSPSARRTSARGSIVCGCGEAFIQCAARHPSTASNTLMQGVPTLQATLHHLNASVCALLRRSLVRPQRSCPAASALTCSISLMHSADCRSCLLAKMSSVAPKSRSSCNSCCSSRLRGGRGTGVLVPTPKDRASYRGRPAQRPYTV